MKVLHQSVCKLWTCGSYLNLIRQTQRVSCATISGDLLSSIYYELSYIKDQSTY